MDAFQAIKQPPPSIAVDKNKTATQTNAQLNSTTTKRKYNRPNVGVIAPMALSRTPLGDTLQKKEQENPYTVYKLNPTRKKIGNFQSLLSLGTFVLGGVTLLKALAKKSLQ